MNKQLALFERIGIAEAISYIALLGFAVPLKHLFDLPLAVKYVGWAHGLLFIAYLVSLYLAAEEQGWGFKTILLAFIASLIPFGPFFLHKWFLAKRE